MKKIMIMFLLLAAFTTGCSYKVTSSSSQELQGENENWNVEYKINFTADYPQEDGKMYAHHMERGTMIITYKKHLSYLAAVKHMEIFYKDSFGNGGNRSDDFDSPPTKKQFQFRGGASATTYELGDYLGPENLHKSIMIFSGPSDKMRANATATVTIQADGETDTIQLLPVNEPSPILGLLEQIKNKLSKKPFLRFFSGYASDLSLKLEKYNVRVVTDQSISGSIEVTEGDEKGKELVPTVLFYEFTIRNEGRKTISGSENDLQMKIVPSDNLKKVSKETVGIDIFEPDSDLGYGQSIEGNLFNSNEDCKFTLEFDLSKESPPGTLITPSEEDLQKLLDNASDASFIITYKDQEAARFDLNKYQD